MNKFLKWPIHAAKEVGCFFAALFMVIGMAIIDLATHRSPDDITG